MSDDLKFSYSCHLIKSMYKNDIRKGIKLMESELCLYTCTCTCIYTSTMYVYMYMQASHVHDKQQRW